MRIETALKRRDRAVTSLRDLYSVAAMSGTPSVELETRYREMIAATLKGAPEWVRTYLDGYKAALMQSAYRDSLAFGGFVDGVFCTTHRNRPDYYEKRGISPVEFADDGRVEGRGHYWISTEKPRPFFIA